MASGVLGLRTTSVAVLFAIMCGEAILALSGVTGVVDAIAGGAGLLLSAAAIPILARTRMLALTAAHGRVTREQLEARLSLGERLAKGTTPNPTPGSGQPVADTEGMVANLMLPAKKALMSRTAIFYWYNEKEDSLVPVESLSDCPELLSNAPVSLQAGRLAGLKTSREPTAFRFSAHEKHDLPVYKKRIELAGLLTVPIHHRGTLAAALVFDRAGSQPFFLPETVMAKRLGAIIEDSLVTERRLKSAILLSQQLRMMDEAARQFSTARAFDQVYDTAVRHAVAFSPFRTAVLAHRLGTSSDDYEIVGVNRKQYASLLGERFGLRGTLCELAARAKTHLPPSFVFERRMPQPFGKDVGIELEEDEPCLLIPLLIRDEAVGFLLLADNERVVERDDLVSLFLFADYCAVSLVNAEANKELERMATSDPLTGIPNHRAFRTRIVEATQRSERTDKPLSLLFLDIDHFKMVNDSHGHAAGDLVLRRVARTLADSVRKVDFVARYGGEEFVAVLEESDSEGALIMGERLRQRVAKLNFEDDVEGLTGVTVSVGISSFPHDTKNVEELIALSDSALYRAKNEGRDQCQVA